MTLIRSPKFMWGGLLCTLVFAVLLGRRLGLVHFPQRGGEPATRPVLTTAAGGERWMKIIQDGRQIGFSHSILSRTKAGYTLEEKLALRLNTMGLVQDLYLTYDARLEETLALRSFRFAMRSGRFDIAIEGQMQHGGLITRIESSGTAKTARLAFETPPFLPASILPAVAAAGLVPGRSHRFPIFDPATMGRGEVNVTVVGRTSLAVGPQTLDAHEVELNYKGLRQRAWIDAAGSVLKEEGLLGLQQIRATREEALKPLAASSDLTRRAAVIPDRPIPNAGQLKWLRLRLDGIDPVRLPASDLRQTHNGRELVIRREALPADQAALVPSADMSPYLTPAPMVQADDPRIRELAKELTDGVDSLRGRIEAIMTWMAANIEKRPVLSLPDALNTLTQRMGDCNEHAVLLAALARAAGIPTQIEAGLVYQKGRFYYHAWNRVYLNGWVTVDALMGQIPADVTHVRLARGDLAEQMEILPLIGNLNITILEAETAS